MQIRLDYLQNPPLDTTINSLIMPEFNYDSIAYKEENIKIENTRASLKNKFNKSYALPFNFSCGGFLELFSNFKKIYYTPSLHYEIRRAIEIISTFIPTIKLDSPVETTFLQADINLRGDIAKDDVLMIMPLINEDIFSFNKIPEIRNATFAIDVSYALALGIEIDYTLADILLINSAPLGILSGNGAIISSNIFTSIINKKGVTEAIYKAIDNRILKKKKRKINVNLELFDKLKELLGKEIDLFANDFAPNTLPLRFYHINTRYLIEHLYLDDIFIQSSQDCYLGFIKPSHTLISLGFSPLQSRELCAITFDDLDDIDLVANKLANGYKMIRLMEF
ncbi:hypothetical protein [Helicobacter sp. MIT 14-3879]|uniref:hypothetical protein n=1 Tax=Helicobacter sp. MIT 14-3879 TaxID=2040649 RepID=UPI0011C05D3D|nr:hypothetical protein [Helicobacter sp. MIT 14-3879]